jgi:hypothetical protein
LGLLRLQDFHNHEERNGHDGALNALFARRFLLSDIAGPDTARAYSNEDKLTRIGVVLANLIREVLSSSVSCGTFSPDAYEQFM